MVKGANMKRTIGLILLVAGLAIGIYGFYAYQVANQSLGNAISKAVTGNSQAEQQSVFLMIGGIVAAIIGLVLVFIKAPQRRG